MITLKKKKRPTLLGRVKQKEKQTRIVRLRINKKTFFYTIFYLDLVYPPVCDSKQKVAFVHIGGRRESNVLHQPFSFCFSRRAARPNALSRLALQLLYLNYESASKPVYMYVNTPGTSTPDGRAIGFETEAFAISDCMNYIKPPVYTIGVGQVLTVLFSFLFLFLCFLTCTWYWFSLLLICIGLHCFVLVFVCVCVFFVFVFMCFFACLSVDFFCFFCWLCVWSVMQLIWKWGRC